MTNTERIQAHNAELRKAIVMAENLPDNTGATHPEYEGEYTVIPSTDSDIILETANKLLDENVKVNKIPYSEVSNNSGGKTASIG